MIAFVPEMNGQLISPHTMHLLQLSAFMLLGVRLATGILISDEERLMNHLFRGYNPSARPVLNSSSTVNVNLRFSLLQIQDLDVRNQILTTTGLLILDWIDERLAWTDALSDLDEVVVHGGNIWRPEFAVINGAESIYGEYTEFQATVRSDGSIRWEPGGVFKTMCNIDITYYPFDEQVCELVFGSWSYYTTKMNISTDTTKIHLDTYETNGEWEITATSAMRKEFNFECCPHQRFSNIQFRLELRRRHTFYIMNVILPGILTSAVLLSIFYCIPAQKVHIGVAALLSYRLFLVNVADTIPRTSDHVPLLGIYLTCTMAITTLAMLATVLVGNLYETKDKPVPDWAKKVFFVYVDRFLCLCRFSQSTNTGSQVHAGINGETSENGSTSNDLQLDRFRLVTLLNPVAVKGHDLSPTDHEGRRIEGQRSTEGGGPRSRLDSSSANFMSRFRQSVQVEERKAEVADSKPNYKKDWMEVAAVCDRFFFWLCLIFILVTTSILFHPLAMSSRLTIDEH